VTIDPLTLTARFEGTFGALIGAAVAGASTRDVVIRDGHPAGPKALAPWLLVKQDQATDVGAFCDPDGAIGAIVTAPEGATGARLLPPLHADRHNTKAVIRADNRVRIPPPRPGGLATGS
jgi:hypothetical protein